MEPEYEPADQLDTEINRATEIEKYKHDLLKYLDDLFMLVTNLRSKVLRGKHDEELVNATISQSVTIMSCLLPKLEGGGQEAYSLLQKFEPFRKWQYDITLPKREKNEANKIFILYDYILKAYDLLGLTKV